MEGVSVGGGAPVDVVGIVVLLSEKHSIVIVKMNPPKMHGSLELLFDNKEDPGT